MSEFDAMLAAGRRPKLDRPAAIAAAIGNVAEPEGNPYAPLASAGAMASTLGCDVGATAASYLLMSCGGGFVIVVASAAHRPDERAIAAALGERSIAFANTTDAQ